MIVGFVLACRLPISVVVGLPLAMEVIVGYWIRDNLTLNIIMLMHPIRRYPRLASRRLPGKKYQTA